ncbi:D-arabinono-1,4-lactone oxidase [Lysinibacter cavernae]|uniref:FAD-linked oxidoreductase n=1 Tax=Lysinibacter cavernae TaxID=1640652 RepID=A0A7X5R0S6_9MICO|nr:D-arabinono-1,4-lactone oxidase [Lysinibacter cavernae]NIH53509.1 FAD-linked oxidoreductase [Lysinibacter cavernae]
MITLRGSKAAVREPHEQAVSSSVPVPNSALWRNWGRVESSTPSFIAAPASAGDVQAIVRDARDRSLTVKPIGASHSFTAIGATSGIRLTLDGLSGLVAYDRARGRVTIGAGTHLYELGDILLPLGLALENMGDIDRQTISGAISTGTHGTGASFGGIATQVVGVTLVDGQGNLVRVNEQENPDLLPAVALGLGALGVLVDVTLQCVPAFVLSAVERPLPVAEVLESFVERSLEHDHFEFYWFPHTQTALTKTNTRLPNDSPRAPLSKVSHWVDDELMANGLYRAVCGIGKALPSTTPPVSRFIQRLTGNRSFSDYSHRVFVTDRSVRFREMEYALPLDQVVPAVREIMTLIERKGWRVSFPIEVRSAAADGVWMSTANERLSGYIAVHRYWRENHVEYFEAVERILRSYGGRPHWGKMHQLSANDVAELYPHLPRFLAARDRLDPARVFANPYLDRVLGR